MDFTKESGLEDFELFKKSIEMIYYKNYFIDYKEKENLNIHLYFENIIIKNSDNQTHSIKDLFVIIKFNYNYSNEKYELCGDLLGYRTFITQNEANNEYLHSHLSNDGEFCLGEGPLKSFMSNYGYSMTINKENLDLFDEMLLMIFHYVKWESIEGVPYRYIRRLVGQKQISKYIKINTLDINSFNQNIDLASTPIDFISLLFSNSNDIKLDENKYILKFDQEIILNYFNDGMLPDCYATDMLVLYKGTDGFLYKKSEEFNQRNNDPINVMRDNSKYLPEFPIALESGVVIEDLSTEEGGNNSEIEFTPFINKGFLQNVIKHIEKCVSNKMQ